MSSFVRIFTVGLANSNSFFILQPRGEGIPLPTPRYLHAFCGSMSLLYLQVPLYLACDAAKRLKIKPSK